MKLEWRQIQPQTDTWESDTKMVYPCGRDIWGNSFVHQGALYIFGGAWERYGRSQRWRDHGKLGSGNDLWHFDPATERWTMLEADDGSLDYSSKAQRPGARMLASFSVVDDYAYLFGGLAVLERGFVLRGLNDFWRYHVPSGRWELIHADTGWCNFVNQPSHPPMRDVHGAAVIGGDIYIFGGWPGTVPVLTVNDLWRYDTLTGDWEQLFPWRSREQGAGYSRTAVYLGSRYCANFWAYQSRLYLFSGRDTGQKNPEFFNDLWCYDPAATRWILVNPDQKSTGAGNAVAVPAARYGSGYTVLGEYLYLFGGHSGTETCVERNDFWRYHMPKKHWEQLHPDGGWAVYGPQGRHTHPPVRRVPIMESVGASLFLFGGINCFMGTLEQGYSLPLNDLWCCRVPG